MLRSFSLEDGPRHSDPRPPDDFVSFPTLPDPEVAADRSLSSVITNTLRKVTNNASNLVHTYTSPGTGPDHHLHHDIIDSLSLASQNAPLDVSPREPTPLDSLSLPDVTLSPRVSNALSLDPVRSHDTLASPSDAPAASIVSAAPLALRPDQSIATSPPANAPQLLAELVPRVTSDNRGLRLLTLTSARQAASLLSKSDVTVVNTEFSSALALLGPESPHLQLDDPAADRLSVKKFSHESKLKPAIMRTLQSRISSIFNNLPNDIEVSDDDSASDIESLDNEHSPRPLVAKLTNHLQSKLNRSPSSSRANRSHAPSRKISSTFSATLLDGAKSYLSTNLAGVSSTTSSVVHSIAKKKKKKRPHKLSENPLKSGGIPKQYWMNDLFVSECLNCLKPFTAFRRKHHCRFCGQIFCATCTTFISYTQYKEKRQSNGIVKPMNSFKDKLRVCKPCYSDVIVYLSDDSLSSSEEEDPLALLLPDFSLDDNRSSFTDEHSNISVHDRQLSRIRSYSVNSRRDSVFAESPVLIQKRNGAFREGPTFMPSSLPDSHRSPEGMSFRHPPQMAIPTTRAGESVEIPVSSNSYSQSTPLKSHVTLQMSRHGPTPLSLKAADLVTPQKWQSRRAGSVPNVADNLLASIENISSFYKAVVNKRYGRLSSNSKNDFSEILLNSKSNGHEDNMLEEDFESENEDEKVMSLYTSLNHPESTNEILLRPHIQISTSLSGVPTLHEFPYIDDKYLPAIYSHVRPRFDFKSKNLSNESTLNDLQRSNFDNQQRSNFRSNERAKASLRRIKDRRTNRPSRSGYSSTSKIPFSEIKPTISPGHANLPTTPISPTPRVRVESQSGLQSSRPSSATLANKQNSQNSVLSNTLSKHRDESDQSFQNSLLFGADDQAETTINLEDSLVLSPQKFDSTDIVGKLEAAYGKRLAEMTAQCLADCDIRNEVDLERWTKVLQNIFAKIDELRVIDTLDIKQYIKIKKILGGTIEDTHVMDGLFITKNIDSKKMQSEIQNPKIALLVFPLEYFKQKEQYMSLRIVSSQQSVYVSNLVSRLISLEPDIVIVGDTVCGLALKLLEDANITVISNVKPQVIERISRYTKSAIFQSVNDLFFKKGSLGTCAKFEVKKFIFKDVIKTFSFFIGSDPSSGFTICLRGGDEEYLSSAKYATESLIPGSFSSRFEKQYFADYSLRIENTEDIHDVKAESLHALVEAYRDCDSETMNNNISSMDHFGVSSYLQLFADRFLSFSPSVKFPIPSSLLNLINAFESLCHFYDFNKSIADLDTESEIKVEWLEKLNLHFNFEKFNGKLDILRILKFVSTDTLQALSSEFNFRLRIWSNNMKYTTYQLYPIFHRSINFLHSRISIKHATPCYGPVIVIVDYYSENDKCVGVFLDQMLEEAGKSCDECGELNLNHYKTYAHGNAKIDLIIEKLEEQHVPEVDKGKNTRVMWSYCRECNFSTPSVPMSDETYNLSLGKFLEISFWSTEVLCEYNCPHDFFKSHVKYFGLNGYVIRMEYSPIDTYEVVVPRKQPEYTVIIDIETKLHALEQIQTKSSSFFLSVMQRLERVKVDTFDRAEAGDKKVEELKQRLSSQRDFISKKTLQIYDSTQPTNYLSMNVIYRDLQELGVKWDQEFFDFENQFLPTENEITKITQFHLKKFLMDRLDNDWKGEFDQGNAKSEKANSTDDSTQEPNQLDSSQSEDPTPKRAMTVGSRRVPLTIIEDKILQFKQSLENDQKYFPKSPTKTKFDPALEPDDGKQTAPKKVQDLTNYFNQMTLEFQKQRERVLEKQSNKYKAVPIVNSLPIVEIYDNIEDVVGGESQKPALKIDLPSSTRYDSQEVIQDGADDNATLPRPGAYRKPSTFSLESKSRDKPRVEMLQPEKSSLLKSLSNFWADRSATLWEPLAYPLDFTEHTFADSDVIVREDEPSSLVAFCLSTRDYKQKINNMATDESNINGEDAGDNLEHNEQFKMKSDSFAKLEKKFKKRSDKVESEVSHLDVIMNKAKTNHLKYQFMDGNTEMSCKIFYSEQFDAFRSACGLDELFVQSLSRCIKWNSKGGKSGSNFLKTLDNRFILKELSKSELDSFVSIAPFYFKYISQSTFNTLTTALAKIYGFYQVEFKNSINGKTFKMDFLIMENLFYNRTTTRIFDLKGSMRNRHVKQTGKENEVLLDENMIEYIYESPVFVKEQLKKLLRGSLFNDTSFLSAMDVMDYSLVIGIDDSSRKLYVGIIDWLRTFTWDKKVENWVKGKSLVSKRGKDPTIVTPKQYRIRFREAMDRYILEVPDIWYEGAK